MNKLEIDYTIILNYFSLPKYLSRKSSKKEKYISFNTKYK